MTLICQSQFTIDVAPCFVLAANRSLVGILHNNGLQFLKSTRWNVYVWQPNHRAKSMRNIKIRCIRNGFKGTARRPSVITYSWFARDVIAAMLVYR
jgi:hypothetical protein